ncbi:MAG TPA: mechanosensitive ion channel family protein [Bryobacteraceae bacterium]|nr:mechanosensitive ion channel family protein [Bryobacteraceae bacterium]
MGINQMRRMVEDPYLLIVPVLLLGLTLLVGLFVRRILISTLGAWAKRTNSHLGDLLSGTLRGSILLWFAILGVHLATQSSRIPPRYLHYIPKTLAFLWILSLTIAFSRLAGNAVRYYGTHVAGDGEMREVASLTQKLAQLIVVSFGIVLMLKIVFDINLTPVLATLGVGGLAVALALQDTLSNLFAGFYVSISGLLRIGDYIRLSTGEEGYVSDINWRCTTIRGMTNNIVVIPNSKLGQAIYTNYCLPDKRTDLSFSIGVAVDSDVDRVEEILLEETIAASRQIPGMVSDPQPYIRFVPGPSAFSLVYEINFSASEFGVQGQVQSELRKRIFKRLRKEGIVIPYPTSMVISEPRAGA